jgi:hypothetical protein
VCLHKQESAARGAAHCVMSVLVLDSSVNVAMLCDLPLHAVAEPWLNWAGDNRGERTRVAGLFLAATVTRVHRMTDLGKGSPDATPCAARQCFRAAPPGSWHPGSCTRASEWQVQISHLESSSPAPAARLCFSAEHPVQRARSKLAGVVWMHVDVIMPSGAYSLIFVRVPHPGGTSYSGI